MCVREHGEGVARLRDRRRGLKSTRAKEGNEERNCREPAVSGSLTC